MSKKTHNTLKARAKQLTLEEAEKTMPGDKGKLYLIYKALPNTPNRLQVLHGVSVSNVRRVMRLRAIHNLQGAWLAIPATKLAAKIGRLYINIGLVQDSELLYQPIPPRKQNRAWYNRYPNRVKAPVPYSNQYKKTAA